jgi:hypothetical protein
MEQWDRGYQVRQSGIYAGASALLQLNIGAILLVGAILRIAWALAIPVVPLSDSHAYDTFATNIWQHGVYGWTPESPTSYWPVGTSALYALIYQIFGHQYAAIVGLNILFSLGIIFYAYKTTELFFYKSVAAGTALLVAVWPTHIFFVTILASELPYMLLTLMGIFYFFKEEKVSPQNILIIGTCFALAYYVRPLATTVLAVCAFSAVVACGKRFTPTIIRTLLVLLIMALAVSPWAKRNYDLYGHVVPMSTNGGAVFWMGNTPGTEGGYHPLPEYVKGLNEHERNQTLKKEAVKYIQEEPLAFLLRTAEKFVAFHSRETIGITWNEEGIKHRFGAGWIMPLKLLSQCFWLTCLIIGLIGILIYLRKSPFKHIFHPFLLLWLSSAGLHALIVAQDRYHIPVVPFIFAFSIYGVHYFAERLRMKRGILAPESQA